MRVLVLIGALLLAAGPATAQTTSPAKAPAAKAADDGVVLKADDQRLINIKANAAMVIEKLGQASEIDFGYDQASVEWLDGFIERQRVRVGGDGGRMIDVLGSYLGEAIIARTGGAWAVSADGQLGVRFPNGDWAFPFSKVRKQWAAGREEGESIVGFYTVAVEQVATGKLGKP
jgi:hypothetical protein